MLAIVEAGLSVPGDIAVLGYDDREFAADLGLSTLIQPHADMAMRAMAILARGRDMELPSTIQCAAGSCRAIRRCQSTWHLGTKCLQILWGDLMV